nr:auxin transport protein BIG [Tanacetum cinerariifolium]
KQSYLLLNADDLDAMWVCLRENYVIMMTPLVQGRIDSLKMPSNNRYSYWQVNIQCLEAEQCLLCAQSSSRCFRMLNLLMSLLPTTLSVGENTAEYFELLFKMIETEDACLFLTIHGCLTAICKLITQENSYVYAAKKLVMPSWLILFEYKNVNTIWFEEG